MKESLRIKLPGALLKLPHVEIKPLRLGFKQDVHHFLQKVIVILPPEVIMTFFGIQVMTSTIGTPPLWLPYASMIMVLLLRMFSNSFQSDERPFNISGFMVVISVVAYAIWNSAIAVFFFLCTLLLMTF
ncbi:MAG: hypothetical protein R8N23_12265 [Reichenbachiella sp.]|uniref:hypothetical protein n=1 Tax=Reichenbachiella sp. TaxID=2184521 RepID=UPI002966B0C5|nr:hypothetical protein [Reichenbachiella sp.]MDW3210640.1 hypothetical protein [Reichenbachiella sp.]